VGLAAGLRDAGARERARRRLSTDVATLGLSQTLRWGRDAAAHGCWCEPGAKPTNADVRTQRRWLDVTLRRS
jgi:hypothetical protein